MAKTNASQKVRPALTPEARENQMISLAMNLVEQRLLDGSASSQETTHFLKLGTTRAELEREKLKAENELLKVKAEAYQSAKEVEAMYAEAITAMRGYSGQGNVGDEDDY